MSKQEDQAAPLMSKAGGFQGYPQLDTGAIPGVQYQPQPSAGIVVMPPGGKAPPDDYLMATIFTTLFCFWPVGIFAIMKAIRCRDANARGDFAEAAVLSKSASRLLCWTIVAGIAEVFFLVVVMVVFSVYFQALASLRQHE